MFLEQAEVEKKNLFRNCEIGHNPHVEINVIKCLGENDDDFLTGIASYV